MIPREVYERYQTEWSDIQGHLPWLREHARGNVLEIGTRTGISTAALLLGVEEHGGHVWSIDVDSCGHLYAGHPQWTFVQVDSKGWQFGAALDLLLIDGDHSLEGCLSDLQKYGPQARVIACHDSECPYTWPGVRKAIEQFLEERPERSVIWHYESYGLAEIR